MSSERPVALDALIRELESRIDKEKDGLPEPLFLFVSRVTPLVNVDLLIRDDNGRTLLTWRNDEFYGPGWHVPGGIIRYKETASDWIRIVAQRELCASVTFDVSPVYVHENIEPRRSERGHFISLLYRCHLRSGLDPHRRYCSANPLADQWEWHDRCPENLIPEQCIYAPFFGNT